MKRPILIATIGFIIGIIWGLYFNMVSFLLILIILYFSLYIFKFKKIIRIIKIFLSKKALILFSIFFLISSFYIQYLEKRYNQIYNSLDKIQCIGTVISEKKEKDYNFQYKISLEKINNKKINNKVFYLSIKKKNCNIKYADKISFEGEYIKPEVQRNYKGFDYSKYLKTQGIYGTIKTGSSVEIMKENNLSFISIISNKIRNRIIENTNKLFPEKTKGIFLGILIGYDEFITEDVKENFSNSSLSHLLAVSGAHVTYVVLGITLIIKYLRIPKEKGKIVTCILLVFYLYIINFTPSVTRTVIMSIIAIMQMVLHRKQDIPTTISFSSLLILISNPYKILNIGFILSYAGTIGIILFIERFQKLRDNNVKIKLIKMIKEICYVTISAWILIFPITIYYFNTISLTFILSNLIAVFLIGPITIIGLIIIVLSFINIRATYIIVNIYNYLLIILLKSTEIIAKIPISNIYVKTPNVLSIIIYYLIIIIFFIISIIKKSKRVYLNKRLNFIILKFLKNI